MGCDALIVSIPSIHCHVQSKESTFTAFCSIRRRKKLTHLHEVNLGDESSSPLQSVRCKSKIKPDPQRSVNLFGTALRGSFKKVNFQRWKTLVLTRWKRDLWCIEDLVGLRRWFYNYVNRATKLSWQPLPGYQSRHLAPISSSEAWYISQPNPTIRPNALLVGRKKVGICQSLDLSAKAFK